MSKHSKYESVTQMKWDMVRQAAAKTGLSIGRDLKSTDLVPGMKVAMFYETGIEVVEFLGVTGDDKKYGEGGVRFKTIAEALIYYKCRTLLMLEVTQGVQEYGHHSYLYFRDVLADDEGKKDEGGWAYLMDGRWVCGSGAQRVSFVELISAEEEAVRAERKVEVDRLKAEKNVRNEVRQRASYLAEKLFNLMSNHPDIIKPEMTLTEVMVLKNKLEK